MDEILEKMAQYGVIPVIAIDDAKDAVNLAQALLTGGLPFAEITFRTDAAEQSIRNVASQVPDMIVGAGSVLNRVQAQKAVDAGARFIVSAGFDTEVVEWCLGKQIPVTPGIATPTEIMMALSTGLRILKFFPAEVIGGPKALKAISAPFPGIRYIPTGGVNPDNLRDYLSMSVVHCCGGSWLTPKKLISEGKFDEITSLTKSAMQLVQAIRSEK